MLGHEAPTKQPPLNYYRIILFFYTFLNLLFKANYMGICPRSMEFQTVLWLLLISIFFSLLYWNINIYFKFTTYLKGNNRNKHGVHLNVF